jgi:hypothetical protein
MFDSNLLPSSAHRPVLVPLHIQWMVPTCCKIEKTYKLSFSARNGQL